jgi:hypothetical protein
MPMIILTFCFSVKLIAEIRQKGRIQRYKGKAEFALKPCGLSPLPLARWNRVCLFAEVNGARHPTRLVGAVEVFHVASIRERGRWGFNLEIGEDGREVAVANVSLSCQLHP